jgi:hypothetical protein
VAGSLAAAPIAPLACRRLKADDPFQVNEVFTAVWNCMGLYPLLYAAILIPAARGEEGKVRRTGKGRAGGMLSWFAALCCAR